jgi:hypothetical protein
MEIPGPDTPNPGTSPRAAGSAGAPPTATRAGYQAGAGVVPQPERRAARVREGPSRSGGPAYRAALVAPAGFSSGRARPATPGAGSSRAFAIRLAVNRPSS